MNLTWLKNDFICEELHGPFVIKKDYEYINDLEKKYLIVLKRAQNAGADEESILIIKKYKDKIIKAINSYYKADISKCNTIIKNLIMDIGKEPFAVSTLKNSSAFPGTRDKEIQFFRCRLGEPSNSYRAKDMLHLPVKMRAKSGNYRFSIPGNPSLYLSNSSYGCWLETNLPADSFFNVSPVILDGSQIIFNLAISLRDHHFLNEYERNRVHCWIKLFMLAVATSYRVEEKGRTFKSEYIVSQSIMMACKKLKYDGVAYYSKRVSNESFALCAINLALFVDYDKEYSNIVKHLKIDDAFNYSLYKKLSNSLNYKEYTLRLANTGFTTNIGNYDRQYPYRETEFYDFDKFLFTTWHDKPNGKGKDDIPWGINISD